MRLFKDDRDVALLVRPSQRDFRAAMAKIKKRAYAEAARLMFGEIGTEEWGDLFYQTLLDGHAEAYGLGRGRSGDLAEDVNDFLRGRQMADTETEYLQGFIHDLDDGWGQDEEGNWKPGKFQNRISLYVHKMRGTAGKAFVDTSTDEAEFTWVLGATEEHCLDCPQLAALSPYTKDRLFSYPGSSDTPCLGNCKCFLLRDDGITSFKPLEL